MRVDRTMMGSATANRKSKKGFDANLNLVSLMDIFTILVFFLLLNSGESQDLEKADFVKLPNSTATPALRGDLIISINDDHILLDQTIVAKVSEVMRAPQKEIKDLSDALSAYVDKKGDLSGYEKANGLAVTIMGDRAVPYTLLKSVMATCSLKDFRDISLAVNQIAGSSVASNNTAGSSSQSVEG